LESLGYDVIVPRFTTRSWLGVAGEAKRAMQKEKPDVVHLFNVPDIIYHNLGKLKGTCFQKLIYDYRSPWGVELQMAFGPAAKPAGEYFERELAGLADTITAVNRRLLRKCCPTVRRKTNLCSSCPTIRPEVFWIEPEVRRHECS